MEIKGIKFNLQYREHQMILELTKDELKLKSVDRWPEGIRINVNGERYTMKKDME